MLHVVHLMAEAKMAGLFRAVGLAGLDHSSPQIDDDTQTCRCLGDGAQETDKREWIVSGGGDQCLGGGGLDWLLCCHVARDDWSMRSLRKEARHQTIEQ